MRIGTLKYITLAFLLLINTTIIATETEFIGFLSDLGENIGNGIQSLGDNI